MIEVSIIERGEPEAGWMTLFREYASIPDGSPERVLNALLVRAVLRVQEYADRSLLPCTMRVHDSEAAGGVRLYQSVDEVVSVTDNYGNAVDYTLEGRGVTVSAEAVTVTYRTEPVQGDIDQLLPVVLQYATALYDGAATGTLTSILKQCL